MTLTHTSCLGRAATSAARSIVQEGQPMLEEPMPLPDAIAWLGVVLGQFVQDVLVEEHDSAQRLVLTSFL